MAHSRSSSTTSSASSASSRRNVGGLPYVFSRPAQHSLSNTACAWWNASFDELLDEDEEDDLFLAEASSSSSLFSPSRGLPDDDCSSACSTLEDGATQCAIFDDIFTSLESVDVLLAFFPSPLASLPPLSRTTSWDFLPDSDDDDYTTSSEEFRASLCLSLDFSSSSSSSSTFSSPTISRCTTPDDSSYSSFVDFSDLAIHSSHQLAELVALHPFSRPYSFF
ncbi:hypothetical protein JCM8547_002810 [Rhodosporidiobolus lusitaniae]